MINSRGDNILEEPHAEHRTRYTPDGRRDHVGDGRGDLDRQQTGNTHQETKDTLSLSSGGGQRLSRETYRYRRTPEEGVQGGDPS